MPGAAYEDLQETPLNTIVLQSDDVGASLSDPLNVIPDDYKDQYDYDAYDPNDVPADQARPEELNTYVAEEQPSYAPEEPSYAPEQPSYAPEEPSYVSITQAPAPAPAFDVNLRETVTEFATVGPADVAITTYSPDFDFNLGSTSAEGIEVVNLVTAVEEDPAEYLDDVLAESNELDSGAGVVDLRDSITPVYDDEYELEELTSYQPESNDIPIVVEDGSASEGVTVDLPSYDPVVLLVGTPVKVRPVTIHRCPHASQLPLHPFAEYLIVLAALYPRLPSKYSPIPRHTVAGPWP